MRRFVLLSIFLPLMAAALPCRAEQSCDSQIAYPFCSVDPDLQTVQDVLQSLNGNSPARAWIAHTSDNRVTISDKRFPIERSPAHHSGAFIRIDPGKKFQTIDGFGGALTQSCTTNLMKLSPSDRTALLKTMFSPSQGGLSYVRVPLGTTDFATSNYTYADNPTKRLDQFSLKKDEDSLALLKEIKKINPQLSIMLSPWTAPPWMKNTGNYAGGRLKPESRQVYAEYLAKTLKAYQNLGLEIRSLSVQNEPHLPWLVDRFWFWPAMAMSPHEEHDFVVDFLGPELKRQGLQPELYVNDHNWDHARLYDDVIKDPKFQNSIAGMAYHCYGGSVGDMAKYSEQHPNLKNLNTECSGTIGGSDSGSFRWWLDREGIASLNAGVSGSIAWNLCLDEKGGPLNTEAFEVPTLGHRENICKTCRGLVTIDKAHSLHSVRFNPDYKALSLLAHAASPGARRIATESIGVDRLSSVGFENPDGTHSIVIQNFQKTAQFLHVLTENCAAISVSVPAAGAIALRW